jgi:hypothetical protein
MASPRLDKAAPEICEFDDEVDDGDYSTEASTTGPRKTCFDTKKEEEEGEVEDEGVSFDPKDEGVSFDPKDEEGEGSWESSYSE